MDEMRVFVIFDVDHLVQSVYAIYSDTLKGWTCAFKTLEKAKLGSPGKVTVHCRCMHEMSKHSIQCFVSGVIWSGLAFISTATGKKNAAIPPSNLPKLLEEDL